MGRTCSVKRGNKFLQTFVGKSHGKKLIFSPKWKDNIKIDLGAIECECM
jgi:hypothetical protein